MVVPSSIVDNAQSLELKTYLVGQVAKAATLFCVNEIVIVSDDKSQQMKGILQDLTTTEFFVQNLEYLETPQYLRKTLFPRSPALRFAGLMNPLDAGHHLRANGWNEYREGCVVKRPVKENKGSWVNVGLFKQDCQVDLQLQEGTRVTVKLNESDFNWDAKYYTGKVVGQNEPFEKTGTYWGYQVRVAHSISEVFEECPHEGGYDLKVGESRQNGDVLDFIDFQKYQGFKHALVFFGGLTGIEGLVEELETGENFKASETRKLFNEYVNTCPEIGSRSLRTEESLLMSMGALMPNLRAIGNKTTIGSFKPQPTKTKTKSTLL